MYQALLCLSLFAPAKDPSCDCDRPKGTCVVECTTKKVTHPVYDTKCVDYCLPKRSLIATLMCKGDDALCCREPKTKHLLIKKPHTEEKCVQQCVLKPCDCAPAAAPVK